LDFDILPKTFQDAITVTRSLGKRYLWIDSLCIIQYEDGLKDWEKESGRIGSVFGNAYCTITATSAKDSTVGFLERNVRSDFFKIEESRYRSLYLSSVINYYGQDVEKGALNERAWVLQERALSRRTIHFTQNQAYFECGDGVRYKTLTRMRK